jgi:hypothetical protein
MDFASDNSSGASQAILAAIVAANEGPAPAYGADPWTAKGNFGGLGFGRVIEFAAIFDDLKLNGKVV